jgi:hypothetical protein
LIDFAVMQSVADHLKLKHLCDPTKQSDPDRAMQSSLSVTDK